MNADNPTEPGDPVRFGADVAGYTAASLQRDGLTPDQVSEIGRRATGATAATARHRLERGMSDDDASAWANAAAEHY